METSQSSISYEINIAENPPLCLLVCACVTWYCRSGSKQALWLFFQTSVFFLPDLLWFPEEHLKKPPKIHRSSRCWGSAVPQGTGRKVSQWMHEMIIIVHWRWFPEINIAENPPFCLLVCARVTWYHRFGVRANVITFFLKCPCFVCFFKPDLLWFPVKHIAKPPKI